MPKQEKGSLLRQPIYYLLVVPPQAGRGRSGRRASAWCALLRLHALHAPALSGHEVKAALVQLRIGGRHVHGAVKNAPPVDGRDER